MQWCVISFQIFDIYLFNLDQIDGLELDVGIENCQNNSNEMKYNSGQDIEVMIIDVLLVWEFYLNCRVQV